MRVRSLRSYLKLPGSKAGQNDSRLNLQEAAERLGVSPTVVRRLIERKILFASQILPGAPWQIAAEHVESSQVLRAAIALKNREGRRKRTLVDENSLALPGFEIEK
jgi:hypothetical protein